MKKFSPLFLGFKVQKALTVVHGIPDIHGVPCQGLIGISIFGGGYFLGGSWMLFFLSLGGKLYCYWKTWRGGGGGGGGGEVHRFRGGSFPSTYHHHLSPCLRKKFACMHMHAYFVVASFQLSAHAAS